MRIAVDAMGGDYAPEAAVTGAALAVKADPTLEVWLVGRDGPIGAALRVAGNPERVSVVACEDVIGPDEPPVTAVRDKPHASLVETIRLVGQGTVDAAVSAGNTGAMMAAGLMVLGRLGGVERPALPAVLPSRRPPGVLLLDVGANTEARPRHLVQYAWMGALYAEHVLGIPHPRVGLLNIGAEPTKGPSRLQIAYARLARDTHLRFVGNVEGRDILRDAADVLVTDGFVGNVVLKAIEGAAQEILGYVRSALTSDWRGRIGGALARPSLHRLRRRLDYEEVGGVPLLGLNGVVIKAHGSSSARAFQNGIFRASEHVERHVNTLIQDAVGRVVEEESH